MTGKSTLVHLHDTLLEGYELMEDKAHVHVQLDRTHDFYKPYQSVSVIFHGKVRCQIYLNDDTAQVQTESEQWCNLYGMDLTNDERNSILASKHRLDVFCSEPNLVERVGVNEWEELIFYLRLIFDPTYVFDPIQRRFIRDDE
jgi:hypothetical protein